MASQPVVAPPSIDSGSPALLLTGPTAVGKSDVALVLAERLNGEIVSVDSMQVYRGLDLGTAKPSEAERRRVTHHLIDVVGLAVPFDAAQFVKLARAAVAEIRGRGRLPIFCGGTGLYIKAYLQGLGTAPAADPRLRQELEQTPLVELLAELARSDAATYERIDRQNPRRVIRAVEVIRLTGKPFSQQRASWATSPDQQVGEGCLFALARTSGDLHQRIERRVDAMFQLGLVAETQQLLAQGLEQNKTAAQALGYRQVIEHLKGLRTLPESVQLVKIRTRQFAKRQLTWFRRQFVCSWIQAEPNSAPEALAERIAHQFSAQRKLQPSVGCSSS